MNDIVELLWLPSTLTDAEKHARIIKATGLF
jgi:hypothetical protein